MAPESGPPARVGRVVFVYYKVARSQVERLLSAFADAGAPPFALHGQLLRRADASEAAAGSEELQTWMEIYWLPGDDLDPAAPWDVAGDRRQVEAWALAAGLTGIIQGPRHYEAFEACA